MGGKGFRKLLDAYGTGAVASSCTAAPFSSAGVACCRTMWTSSTADSSGVRVYPLPDPARGTAMLKA